MAEKAQSGLLCLSLLQFLMLGCLIYVIANTKNELQLLQEKVNSRIGVSYLRGHDYGVEAENENHVKRSSQLYGSVSRMLFDAMSVWLGGSPVQPIIKCVKETQGNNKTKCSFHSASPEENEAAYAAARLMEDAISRVFFERMEVALNCTFDGDSKTKCAFRPGPPGADGQKGDKGEPGERGEKGNQGPKGLKGDNGTTGMPGLLGLQGEIGRPGAKGMKGDQGPNGGIG